MTLKSGKVYSDTGAPSNTYGVDGDIYMQLDGLKTTYRKEGAVWVAVGSSLGAIPEFISGVGVPSNALGADGQYYRDTGSQNIYYKQGSTWNLVGNLTGASFKPILDQAGIGKDLATAPNFINSGSLNTLTTEGQYAYTSNVTDTPTSEGLVWVKQTYSSTYLWQFVEGANNTLYHRFSGNGGATWSGWKTYATTNLATETIAGIIEKATQAELNAGVANVWPDAATIFNGFNFNGAAKGHITLPSFLGGFTIQWGTKIYGELPASVVTVTDTFDTVMDSIYWAGAFPYNPNLSGQMAFIVTLRAFTVSDITVDMVELSGSGDQFSAGFTWITIGFDS